MNHKMGLNPKYYSLVKDGSKIYEGRLYDEKRSIINVNDTITFQRDPERVENFDAIVVAKHLFKSFREMVISLDKEKLGFKNESIDEIVDIYRSFYSEDDEKKYGVVAIEVKVK